MKKILIGILLLLLVVSGSVFLIKRNSYFQIHKHIIEESWSNGCMPIEIPIIVNSRDDGPFLSFVSTNYDSSGVTSEVMTKDINEFLDSTRKLPKGKVLMSGSKKGDSNQKVIAILLIPTGKYTLSDIRSSIDVTKIEDGKVKVKGYELSLNSSYSIFSLPEIRY
ncbi:hypothetical protein AKL21_05545 [Enterococcus canintestini]|uniref:Uncharacterized protein n=2 Tax=Enterococcus canintestini TaxID=317010 RepID=A0A267HR47_9ENTE|nr:hypothetical protein AKL21_05545 [Enterococcus canintestini]